MTPTSAFQWIATVASVALVLWAGWWLRGCTVPEPEVVTKVEYRDRPLAPKDTADAAEPDARIIYRQTTDTVYIRVAAPRGFTPYGVISSSPVRVQGNEFTLSYWNPTDSRWQQDTFTADEQRWNVNMDAGLQCGPLECAIDGRVIGRYKRVSAYGGYAVGQLSRGWIFGVRVKIW